MSTKIVFFGNERLVSGLKYTNTPVLTELIRHGYDIKAVISHHNDSKSRNQRVLEVAEVAKKHNIPVHLPDRTTDVIDQLKNYNAEVAILVAYGRIIPQHIIDIFPRGIINLHPSLLPKYRGPTPIESAIENGDKETGVSIMQLSAGMDTGPLFSQARINLNGSETKFDVYNQLSHLGADLMTSTLPKIINQSLKPYPQDDSQATYSHLLHKSDALLNPGQLTAIQAERKIRAHLEFPKTKIMVAGKTIVITKAHVSQTPQTLLDIACKDNVFLSIDQLIAPNGKHMSAAAFLRGYAA